GLGADVFTAAFFKKAWGIIGDDVCNAIREFFISEKMLGEINANLISLIPKVQTPSKLLISGLLLVAMSSISESDNILITPEIMKGYNRKGGPKRVAFKIDLQKAYDTVSWKFLKKTLDEFGFHEKMVHWIMQCVTTAGFILNVNGERIGYFKD
ncbi:RNA-directed DNA polymerase, eukaryota, reverse transcriptase zinc-binding domain protein, partial [Tanacetum coccineum]